MHQFSDSIFAKASSFHAHALQQLAGAERALDCCSLSHDTIHRKHWSLWVRAGLWGVIAAAIVALVAYLNPPQRKRVRPVVR
jgi:hypothetical protein